MSTAALANSPAFPVTDLMYPNGAIPSVQSGQTLRQHYAGLALQGLCACPYQGRVEWSVIAVMSVAAADALIAELAKPVSP